MKPHPYTPVVIDAMWGSLACELCGQRGRTIGDEHTCDHCGELMPAGEVNTSNVIDGWYHGTCLAQLVTFEQERDAIDVELSHIGRMASASSALAIRREQGDMD